MRVKIGLYSDGAAADGDFLAISLPLYFFSPSEKCHSCQKVPTTVALNYN